ncbi:uncharacterized protein STEHIDRAFT_116322 [Stereum hirsutum FP-91666 SS1]|uniref:Uncharacterized protein n=1 Tax=Stereum hirsutum (strain FP-91666) TaxID=721885 RepID=R7RYG6_STEHR|nr:uncharacterized protein STEHIDRAFT_116322 [Stereum hirsutum FP-91666 SS1]EIM79858.1 hypothetical protein STEHIDRAFT_116322 [Stereum hirsutum FP-91666 SS1]
MTLVKLFFVGSLLAFSQDLTRRKGSLVDSNTTSILASRRQMWPPHSSSLEFVIFDVNADANSWFLDLGVSYGVFLGEESDRNEKVGRGSERVGGGVEVVEVATSAVLDEEVADCVGFEAYGLPRSTLNIFRNACGYLVDEWMNGRTGE